MKGISHMLLAAVLLAAVSCSVKEGRGPCPSYLTVDASAFLNVSDVAFANLDTRAQNLKDTLFLRTGKVSVMWAADKGFMTAYAFSNLKKSREQNGIVIIPVGEQADPLVGFCSRFECYEELLTVEAVPYRQTALIRLNILNVDGVYPYDLQVEGDVCGIDLKSMSPLEGEFRHDLKLDDNLSCSFYLPRQKKDSRPVINVFHKGTRIDSFPLYSWIEAAGYDWTREDLPDISLDIIHGQLKVVVNVQGWEHEDYEIIL